MISSSLLSRFNEKTRCVESEPGTLVGKSNIGTLEDIRFIVMPQMNF